MAKKEVFGNKKINVTATVDGEQRRLLTLVDSDEGSVRVVLWAGKDFGYEPSGEKILHNKWSVHHTSADPESNTIKRTTVIEGHEKSYETVHRTKAIKKKDQFALVLYSTFCGMNMPIRAVTAKTDGRILNIGEYKTEQSTLAIGLYAGARGATFEVPRTPDRSTFVIETKHFRLLLLSSLLPIPTQDIATIRDICASKRGLYGSSVFSQELPAEGMTGNGCVENFSWFNSMQFDVLIKNMYNKLPNRAAREKMLHHLQSLGNIEL